MTVSFSIGMALFVPRISHIIRLRAQYHVTRIAAFRSIAFVADAQVIGNRAMNQLPCNAMGVFGLCTQPDPAITL